MRRYAELRFQIPGCKVKVMMYGGGGGENFIFYMVLIAFVRCTVLGFAELLLIIDTNWSPTMFEIAIDCRCVNLCFLFDDFYEISKTQNKQTLVSFL